MKLPVIFLLLVFIAPFDVNAQSCHFGEIEACLAKQIAYVADPNTLFPLDEEELKEHCSRSSEAIECLRNFTSRCMTPRGRDMLNFATRPVIGMRNDVCKPGSEASRAWLRITPCMKVTVLSDEFKVCRSDLQAALDRLDPENYYTEVSPLTFSCCVYNRYQSCFRPLLEENCGNTGLKEYYNLNREIHLDLVRPNSVCSCTDPNECLKILPPSGTIPLGMDSPSPFARMLETLTFFSFGN